MLLAAGYAPRYRETPLDGAAMAQVRASLQRLLDAHDPYPGVVIDRLWNVVMANKAAGAMVAGLPADVAGPPTNVFRACLHPNGLAARTLNFEEWAAYLLDQLHRLVALTADPAAQRLLDEVMRYPNIGALRRDCAPVATAPMLLVPLQLDTDARRGAMLSLYTTLTTFGTPLDVTLSELSVELFYPSDDESERMLRAAAMHP
jgi:hypothetical protein